MLDLPILVAICAIVVTFAALCVDAIQTRSIGKINAKVEAFQAGNIGEQLGEWLLARQEGKDPEGHEFPTNLEACASLVGRQIAGSFSMAAKGIVSGESRTLRSVEKAVLEGLQTPEAKALLSFCDQIGIDRSLAGTVMEILEKRGLSNVINKNNGGGSGGWQV